MFYNQINYEYEDCLERRNKEKIRELERRINYLENDIQFKNILYSKNNQNLIVQIIGGVKNE